MTEPEQPFTDPYVRSRDFLIAGLVGHRNQLYNQSPEFAAFVKSSADVMAEVVEVVAKRCEQQMALRKTLMEKINLGLPVEDLGGLFDKP